MFLNQAALDGVAFSSVFLQNISEFDYKIWREEMASWAK